MIQSLRQRRHRFFVALPVAAILGLAAALRFAALPERGLFYWDEGKFALEGIRLLSVLTNLPSVRAASLAGKAIGTAKPTHALLIALSYRVLGVHDYAPLMMNATASVLEVGVLFLLARQFFNVRVALVAAAFLAISGYDIIYARSALSESDADLIFLAGVLLWWSGRRESNPGAALLRRQWAPSLCAGVVLGAGFTVNYRLVVYIAALVAIDLVMTWKRYGWRVSGTVAGAWVAGLLLMPVAWQVLGLAAAHDGMVLFRSEITYRPTSYFSEVLYQIHGGRQSTVQFSPLPYLQWYVVRQGWPLTLLLLVGCTYAAIERSSRWLIPTALIVVPYVAYCFAPIIVPRNLDAALPFAALLSAAALVRVTERVQASHLAHAALGATVLILTLFGASGAWALTDVRSGFARATSYLQQHRSEGAIVVNEVMLFYLRDSGRGCHAPQLPTSGLSLATDVHAGIKYAVIDSYAVPISWYLLRHARAVIHYSTVGMSPQGENLIASENGIPPVSQGPEWVDVYSLQSLHLRVAGFAAPQPCSLDHLAGASPFKRAPTDTFQALRARRQTSPTPTGRSPVRPTGAPLGPCSAPSDPQTDRPRCSIPASS